MALSNRRISLQSFRFRDRLFASGCLSAYVPLGMVLEQGADSLAEQFVMIVGIKTRILGMGEAAIVLPRTCLNHLSRVHGKANARETFHHGWRPSIAHTYANRCDSAFERKTSLV